MHVACCKGVEDSETPFACPQVAERHMCPAVSWFFNEVPSAGPSAAAAVRCLQEPLTATDGIVGEPHPATELSQHTCMASS